MNDAWKNKTVKVQDILNVCEKAADINLDLSSQIMTKVGEGKADVTMLSAYSWFINEERKYRYDIPDIIREAVKGGMK